MLWTKSTVRGEVAAPLENRHSETARARPMLIVAMTNSATQNKVIGLEREFCRTVVL
jgi:hypothetical protein